jgi:hypothetical protein
MVVVCSGEMRWVQPKCPSCGASLPPVDPLHPRVHCGYCRSSFNLVDAVDAYRSDGVPVDLRELAAMVAEELAARDHGASHQISHHAMGGHHAPTVGCMTCGRHNWPHYSFCFGCGLSLHAPRAHTHAAAPAALTRRSVQHNDFPVWIFAITMPLALFALVLYAHIVSRPPPDGGPLCNDGTCKIVQLSCGADFTCGLTDSGHVKCWGGNDMGQLGRDADRLINYAGSVLGLNDTVVSISGNRYRGCAVLRTGRVKCWGGGDGPQPRLLTTPEGVVQASQGYHHTCVLTEDGLVRCGGNNDDEPLTEVLAGEVAQVSAGGSHSCVLTKTGAVKCWGSNDSGQLGDGTTTDSAVLVDVEGLPGEAVSITMGGEHSCALLKDGSAMCWGSNEFGQLGHEIGAPRTEAIDLGGLSMLSAGVDHTCGLTRGGEVYCWGRNDHAQVGDGTTGSPRSPTPVHALGTSAVSVEAGHRHTCAIMDSGGVQCWGMVEGSGSRRRRSPEWVVID